MLLSISLAAAMAAIAFGVVHVAGVTAEDRFTLVHLEFAAVVLVPAALLIAERWRRGPSSPPHDSGSPHAAPLTVVPVP
jgi:hypothetical protein